MTKQHEIISDPKYVPVLDHGFVGLVDSMGSDASVVQAARVSYGSGTKTVREDRGLIRYLMRNFHHSPFEMCEVKLHIKLPIFVMRQLVRHRTASLNEYSGRYSIMSDEFYLPAEAQIAPQSSDNKQGRAGELDDVSKRGVAWLMRTIYEQAYACYDTLLGKRAEDGQDLYDAYGGDDPLLADDFPGIARELARSVLPVANYTECYFKMDLLNLLKMLRLRADSHAQYEIRVFADAIYQLIEPIFPLCCEAFNDYMRESLTLSRMEVDLVRELVARSGLTVEELRGLAGEHGLAPREAREFTTRFSVPLAPMDS